MLTLKDILGLVLMVILSSASVGFMLVPHGMEATPNWASLAIYYIFFTVALIGSGFFIGASFIAQRKDWR